MPRLVHSRYSHVAIGLHWLMAAMVMGNLGGGLLLEGLLDNADAGDLAVGRSLVRLHKSLGLTVLALTLVRLGWRLGHAPPPLPAHMTPLERGLSRASHAGFYGLMLALPLSGWVFVSTAEVLRPLAWFGLFEVPKLPLPRGLYGAAREGHAVMGWALLALLVFHVLAALKHRYLDRDDVLARMWFKSQGPA
jgi:cytochrome b561